MKNLARASATEILETRALRCIYLEGHNKIIKSRNLRLLCYKCLVIFSLAIGVVLSLKHPFADKSETSHLWLWRYSV